MSHDDNAQNAQKLFKQFKQWEDEIAAGDGRLRQIFGDAKFRMFQEASLILSKSILTGAMLERATDLIQQIVGVDDDGNPLDDATTAAQADVALAVPLFSYNGPLAKS